MFALLFYFVSSRAEFAVLNSFFRLFSYQN